MCGINGFNASNKEKIIAMNEATKHRGPDGVGFFVDDDVSLGHNLLAITESPDNSRQPIKSSDGRYILLYNGEIYNYKELQKDLIKEGDSFLTNSDTEVLLKGLVRHGEFFLSKLDGMFAIALYDTSEKNILLARDKAGMKPLYYYHYNNEIVFSSELRGLFAYGIDRKLDIDSAKIYFVLGYVPGNKTLIKNVQKILPGQYMKINLTSNCITKKWIVFEQNKDNEIRDKNICDLIHNSTIRHTMGLRPFGLYLSGGLDSTVILH
ncbi:MAG: asparagine synthetase B, partial [bacterium]|nr:asparagine synthetase B [bacterium]